MEAGLNNHLKNLSSDLFIKYDSPERKKINRSLDIITEKLTSHFGDEVDEIIVFGSYSRDTILPRTCDQNSDIDIMILYSNEYEKLTPESYRNQLRRFAEDNYRNSLVIKDHPSVVIEMNHIKFDLVLAIFDEGFFYDSIEIPDKDGGWVETEPQKFNDKLSEANTQYNSIVKPVIRLLKYWNASVGYPYESFYLERKIADVNFNNDNYQSGFLYAINKLPDYDLPGYAAKKVEVLKNNADWIKEYLEREDIRKAKEVLERILPPF